MFSHAPDQATPVNKSEDQSEPLVGMEEPSQGAHNPADDVVDRPNLPTMSEPLHLGKTINLSDDVVLEVEHLFGSSPVFQGLTKEETREIVNSAEKLPLQPGQELFRQGEVASAVYIIQSGEVQVKATSPAGEEIVLAMLGSSTIVGELALIDGGPRSATVEAISDCDVYRLSREAFDALRAQRRPAAYKVILNLAATIDARRRQSEQRINEVFTDPATHIDAFESQVHDLIARLRKI